MLFTLTVNAFIVPIYLLGTFIVEYSLVLVFRAILFERVSLSFGINKRNSFLYETRIQGR